MTGVQTCALPIFSLFDESDGTQREQEKVQKDFQKMTETKPHFLGTYAVEMYMKTDLIFVKTAMILCTAQRAVYAAVLCR